MKRKPVFKRTSNMVLQVLNCLHVAGVLCMCCSSSISITKFKNSSHFKIMYCEGNYNAIKYQYVLIRELLLSTLAIPFNDSHDMGYCQWQIPLICKLHVVPGSTNIAYIISLLYETCNVWQSHLLREGLRTVFSKTATYKSFCNKKAQSPFQAKAFRLQTTNSTKIWLFAT